MAELFFEKSLFQLNSEQWNALLPYLILCVGIFFNTLAAAFRWSRSAVAMLVSVVLFSFIVANLLSWNPGAVSVFGSSLEVTNITRATGIAVAILAMVVSFFGGSSDLVKHAEWGVVLLGAVLASALLPGARDWVAFFIYLETASIAAYVLTAYDTSRNRSLEAGLKYLFVGAFASAIFLMGITFLYGAVGSFDFSAMASFENKQSGLVVAGVLLVISALGIKLALAPFHMWAPDVYQAAPTAFGAFLATGSKLSLFVALAIGLDLSKFFDVPYVKTYIFVLGTLAVLVGSLMAIAQDWIKRLLAYSGVVNAGYGALLLCSASLGTPSLLLYFFVYGLALIAAFACVEFFAQKLGRGPHADLKVGELANLKAASTPLFMILLFGAAIFSIAGIPPLPGFFAKYFVLRDLWLGGQNAGLALALLGNLVGLAYYLRIFVPLFKEGEMSLVENKGASFANSVSSISAAAAAIAATLFMILVIYFMSAV